ncbi:MAG TPA: isocitrate/isopropylmalate family dehydrogenase, partial [Sphaerochaeta sp.]|nr:isocitrate/isopropylmalate family dehydrogenase [Sphaerochaeta sp.]
PGANINYQSGHAVFEATHGTAPDIAGRNLVNPLSLVLSSVLMLRHLGWDEAAALLNEAVRKTIRTGIVTKDFYSLIEKEGRSATLLGTKEYGERLCALI